LLYGLTLALLAGCPDPKGLGPNLDANIDYDTKKKVHDMAVTARKSAVEAINKEIAGDHKAAINLWGDVFGPNFPTYG
jgi:hypothetical protein